MDQFFDDSSLEWLHPNEINDALNKEDSPFPKKEREKQEKDNEEQEKRDLCERCIKDGSEKICDNCGCSNCDSAILEEIDHSIGQVQDIIARRSAEKNTRVNEVEIQRCQEKLDKLKKQKANMPKGCPCTRRETSLHPCHRNFSSNCFFAYYKAYSVDKNKKAEIHFAQPNLLSAYFKISNSYRGDYNELWPTMVTVTFYHELGHHLVQLYVDTLTHSNYSKHLKRVRYISENDEQKLCEYIGFKKTHELLEQTKTIPEKYKRNTTRGSKKNNMNKRDYDIGNSGIYHKLPLYTAQPFSASFQQPEKERMRREAQKWVEDKRAPNISEAIKALKLIYPDATMKKQVEYVRPINDYSPDKLLSVIAKAKGGRGIGEKFYPEITEATREFINIDKKLWNNLFNDIINSGKTSKKNINKNIITKNNIVTCSDPKICRFPLINKKIENQSEISLDEILNTTSGIYSSYKFIGYSEIEWKDNYYEWKKGRTLDILQKEGYTHQEYRKIRNDSNLKNIAKPKPETPSIAIAPKSTGIKMF